MKKIILNNKYITLKNYCKGSINIRLVDDQGLYVVLLKGKSIYTSWIYDSALDIYKDHVLHFSKDLGVKNYLDTPRRAYEGMKNISFKNAMIKLGII